MFVPLCFIFRSMLICSGIHPVQHDIQQADARPAEADIRLRPEGANYCERGFEAPLVP
jgi:hypothetical protein